MKKVKSKKEVIKEAQKNHNEVHCASLIDLCHLKNSELEPQFQKYKGRVVLRGDIAKDDSVFTEQGSSASQMTAWMSLLNHPIVTDKHLTQYPAYTQVKMDDAQK